jgi:hypothetical protein
LQGFDLRSLSTRSLLITTLFGAIAAIIDIAPATAMVLAGIDKQPTTSFFVSTLTNPLKVFGS